MVYLELSLEELLLLIEHMERINEDTKVLGGATPETKRRQFKELLSKLHDARRAASP